MPSCTWSGDLTSAAPGAAEVAAVLGFSNWADAQLRLRLACWREGFAAGEAAHAGDYDRGWLDAIAYVKKIEHGIVDALRAAAPEARWSVRGQQRTRATYADPHPKDFPGSGEAA